MFRIISTSLAVIAGNWFGGLIRYILTGEKVHSIQFKYTTAKGREMTNSPVATKFFPGLFFAFLGKPRWFFAFIGGTLTGSLVPDVLEALWLERVVEPLIIDRVAQKQEP